MKHYLLGFQMWLLQIPLQTFFGTSDSVTSNTPPPPYNVKHLWDTSDSVASYPTPNPHLPSIGYLKTPEPETQNKIGTSHGEL